MTINTIYNLDLTDTPTQTTAITTPFPVSEIAQSQVSDSSASDSVPDRSVPAPSKRVNRKKRPCASTGGRKEDRRKFDKSYKGSSRHKPLDVKLNRWYLEEGSVTPVRLTLKDTIPLGSRVVEQPVGSPAPSLVQFYDYSLLPVGSSLVSGYTGIPVDIPNETKARFFRTLTLMGVGKETRKHMFDRLSCSANPLLALEYIVGTICGEQYLTMPANSITKPSVPLSELNAVFVQGINISNAQGATSTVLEFAGELPSTLTPREELSALAEIKASVISVEHSQAGTELTLSCAYFNQVADVLECLKNAGGTRMQYDRKAKRPDRKTGAMRNVTDVYVSFSDLPVEVAQALGGTPARLVHSIEGDLVYAQYESDLYGKKIVSQPIPVGPSLKGMQTVLELAVLESETFRDIVELATKVYGAPMGVLCEIIGPDASVASVLSKAKSLTMHDVFSEDELTRLENAPRTLDVGSRKRLNISWDGDVACTDALIADVCDISLNSIPEYTQGINDDASPVTVNKVRFIEYTDKSNRRRTRAVVEAVEVSKLLEERNAWADAHSPQEVIVQECRSLVSSVASETMLAALRTPDTKDTRPVDFLAKRRASNKSEPYTTEGGSMLLLLQVLSSGAQREDFSVWSDHCQDVISAFHAGIRKKRGTQGGQAAYSSIWEAYGSADKAGENSRLQAAAAMLTLRLGRECSEQDVFDILKELESSALQDIVYKGLDKGRALNANNKVPTPR